MKTHDFTKRTWGHDFTSNPLDPDGLKLSIMGWAIGIETNDYLILPNGSGTTRYQVDTITYFRDPSDMFKAVAHFAPRPTPPPSLQ